MNAAVEHPVAERAARGPLSGIKVVEMAGLGPTPFTAMVMADLGAEVVRLDRVGRSNPGNPMTPENDVLNRSRRSVAVDIKHPDGRQLVLDLVAQADVLIEGFRPGVMERLGLGPDDLAAVNPALVFGRMTGFGQTGPLAQAAGHDINYIAVAGVLDPIGPTERPVIPLNLVGDFGGGGMLLVVGILAAVLEARTSGKGQVVDAAIVDGAALLSTILYGMRAQGIWSDRRADNLLDGGCHFYNVYECADGRWLAVGAIEPQFYAALLSGLGVGDDEEFRRGHVDASLWPTLRDRVAGLVASRTLEAWLREFEGTDACVTAVVPLGGTVEDPHLASRRVIVEVDGRVQPAPAPRFSRSELAPPSAPVRPGENTDAALADWGIDSDRVARLVAAGVLGR